MRHKDKLAFAVLVVGTPAISAAAPQVVSWGKLGISIDRYRQDAVECGRLGNYLDVSYTAAAQDLKEASTRLEHNETDLADTARVGNQYRLMSIISDSCSIVAGARPEEKIAEIRPVMLDTVTTCLKQKGYTPFKLTA